jgi:hypothetical protein
MLSNLGDQQPHLPHSSAGGRGTVPGLVPLRVLRRMRIMAKRYPTEQRERATRMVVDRLGE